MSLKIIITCFISITLGFFIGYIFSNNFSSKDNQTYEIRNSQHYKFINPLLECENNSISQDKNLDLLRKKIDTFINQQTKTNSSITLGAVYYRDLNNGPWFGINQNELFSPASLIKVPLLITYYKMAEKDPLFLNKKILYQPSEDQKNQNIKPEATLAPNQEYSLDTLINQMIIYSDNSVYDLLLENISPQKLTLTYTDLGVDISAAYNNPNGNILSVKQYASFFRILFNSSYLNKDMSEKALNLLSKVKYDQGLVAGVPQNILVAHKFGERYYTDTGLRQLHDCGIVYLPNKPYLLCIMTRGTDFIEESRFIKQISAIIFQAIKSR